MELYGPKKRGPKPKTFLLKVGWQCPMVGSNVMSVCGKRALRACEPVGCPICNLGASLQTGCHQVTGTAKCVLRGGVF